MKTITYKVGDIILKIDPQQSPVEYTYHIITEIGECNCITKNIEEPNTLMMFSLSGYLKDENKLQINSHCEYYYYPAIHAYIDLEVF